MRWEVLKNYKGEPYIIWDIWEDGLTSRDFFKEARDFELKMVVFHVLYEEDRVVLYGTENNSQGSLFPSGVIFAVKEEQI